MIPHKNYWPNISIAVNVKICVSPYFLCFSNLAPYLVPRIFMPLVDSLSKHPVCGSHNPRGGTPLYKLYRYVQTIQGRQRRGQSSGSVWSGIWRSTGRILTSADVCEGLLRNTTLQRSDDSCRGSQAFSHARGHFSSLARFARRTKKKGRLLVNYEARRPLTKKPRDYNLDTGCCIVLIFFLIWPCQGLLLT